MRRPLAAPARRPLAAHARWLLAILIATGTTLLLLAPAALAHDGGRGLYGETDDKVATNAGFILIAFFPLFILFASIIQWRLEKRKQARMAAQQARLASAEWRGGW